MRLPLIFIPASKISRKYLSPFRKQGRLLPTIYLDRRPWVAELKKSEPTQVFHLQYLS